MVIQMENIQFSVTGSEASLSELNKFLTAHGLAGKPGAECANDGGGIVLFALLILANRDTFSKCVAAFMRERKKRVRIFQEGKGWTELENYSADEIRQMLSAQHSISILDDPKDQKKKGESQPEP